MSDLATLSLTGKQKNQLHEAVERAPIVPDMARTGAVNPNLRVFVANFDGTQNDKDRISEGEQATLVAHAFETFKANENPAIESRYYKGVGTNTSKVAKLIESAIGMGCTRNANMAHADLARQTEIWRKENPNVEVHVHVTGFSRGSATALHFLNMVDQQGALSKKDLADPESAPQYLRPGFVKSSAVLLDTVSTGQGPRLMLTVPSTCCAILHITAANEQRYFFPLREITKGAGKELSFAMNAHMKGAGLTPDGMLAYQRIHGVELPGVHSDIGGSYKNGGSGVRGVSQYLMENFQQSLGLGVTPVRPTFEEIQNYALHDSRVVRLADGVMPDPAKSRDVKEAQQDTWDGTFVKQIKVTTPEGVVSTALEMGQVKPVQVINLETGMTEAISKDPIFKHFYKPCQVDLIPVAKNNGMGDDHYVPANGVNFLTKNPQDRAAITFDGNSISVLGSKISPNIGVGEIKETWAKQDPSNAGAQALKVEFSAWRLGAMTHTRQDVDCKPQYEAPQAPDPWPKGLRDVLLSLNTKVPPNKMLAGAAMFKTQEGVANALREEFPDVRSVEIQPMTSLSKNSLGMKLANTFIIRVERKDGTTFASNEPASGKADFEISNRMRELRRGLVAVGDGFRKRGFHPAANEPLTFNGKDGKANESLTFNGKDGKKYSFNTIMASLDEPGPPPMDIGVSVNSMKILSAFGGQGAKYGSGSFLVR